jgi:hypothetical protein
MPNQRARKKAAEGMVAEHFREEKVAHLGEAYPVVAWDQEEASGSQEGDVYMKIWKISAWFTAKKIRFTLEGNQACQEMAEMAVKRRQEGALPEKMEEAHLVPYQREASLAVECQELE